MERETGFEPATATLASWGAAFSSGRLLIPSRGVPCLRRGEEQRDKHHGADGKRHEFPVIHFSLDDLDLAGLSPAERVHSAPGGVCGQGVAARGNRRSEGYLAIPRPCD